MSQASVPVHRLRPAGGPQSQGDQLVPVAAFEQNGGTVAADSLHKAGVAVVNRGGIGHGDGGAGRIGAVAGAMARSRTVLEPLSAECATDGMAESKDWLSVGKIVGVQGLQGIAVNPSDFPERFTAPGPRWLRSRKGGEPTKSSSKKAGNCPASRCLWCGLRESTTQCSEALVGQELLVSADDRPRLEEGNFTCSICWG